MTYSNVYTGNFTTPVSPVSAGGIVAGITDRKGNTISVSSNKLQVVAPSGGSYFDRPCYVVGSDNELNQHSVTDFPANLAPGFGHVIYHRLNPSGGRTIGYALIFADSVIGTGVAAAPYVCVVKTGFGTAQDIISGSSTPVGWYNSTHAYRFEFWTEGSAPTTIKYKVRDLTTSTDVIALTTFTDATNTTDMPLQQKGYFGLAPGEVNSNNPVTRAAYAIDAISVETEYSAPALSAPRPVLVTRTNSQQVIAYTATGGTPPYSVQPHRKIDDWGYTPSGATAVGSPLTISSDGGTVNLIDNGSFPSGTDYIYKGVVTDSLGQPVPSGDYLYVQGVLANPGALPPISANILAKGVMLVDLGDSITAAGGMNIFTRDFLVANGVTVTRTANVGFQGIRYVDFAPGSPVVTVQEGAVDTNPGATYLQTYASIFGGAIPGSLAIDKAFYIIDYELGKLGGATPQMVIQIRLGMNDMLQQVASSTVRSRAAEMIAAVRAKYPTALIVIQHLTYGFPNSNGPLSLNDITNAHANWKAICTANVDNVHVFQGDFSAFYEFYLHYGGVPGDAGGPFFTGGDSAGFLSSTTAEHVHPITNGERFTISNNRTVVANQATGTYGEGPALMRTAIAYSIGGNGKGTDGNIKGPSFVNRSRSLILAIFGFLRKR